MASSSSSSNVVPRRGKGGWTYDVFLSFRGEDTRNNFVDHLFAALVQKGIHTFKDDKMLVRGQPISEALVKVINESRWAVVIFSKNYANSYWCLKELCMIMECHDQMGGQKVLPVFYHVDPSDVLKQKLVFKMLKSRMKGEMDKVKKWGEALTAAANLPGLHILPEYGGASAFINHIVQQILADKQPRGSMMSFDGSDGMPSKPSTSLQSYHIFELHEILLATENFNESLVIGSGGFGKVYKGEVMVGTSLVTAAIKRLDLMSNQGAKDFWAEVEMLSKLRHSHLVSLIGYCNHEREMILVYEYMPNGTLEDHLHNLSTCLSWADRLKICIGVARGLDYLHTGTGIEVGVVHRDVNSSNILLNESWEAKISNVGLSRIYRTNQPSTYIKGSWVYVDPHYFATRMLTRKSDVYAFGVVLFEVLCQKRPEDMSLECGLLTWAQDSIEKGNLKSIVDSDVRNKISPKCLKMFARIAVSCTDYHPNRRPTMAEVSLHLESVLIMEQKTNNWLNTPGKSILTKRIGWRYDVFISFRGEDTRNNFVDHLFAALVEKGIYTFKDDKMLGGGQPISEELLKAIRGSRWAVVVFSKNYANSSWCLEELSQIMDCQNLMGQKVLPVFYHVNPSDVLKRKGDFAKAFETHEDMFKGRKVDKVNKWRDALTAASSLSGYRIVPDYGNESKFISKIVQLILAIKQSHGGVMENNLIGIEPGIDALISLLNLEETDEVRIVGIWGMGGIGKTVIARALFNRIAFKFKGSSFVPNIRENSSSKKDICALQYMILKDIFGAFGFKISDPEDGGRAMQRRCCSEKILLVLDDVNDVNQLKFLGATREWFGPGSRIVITTRDKNLLSYVNANDMYIPALLRTDQALELFCRHAFHKSTPPEGYKELSIRANRYGHGLPLALMVLGSFLCGKEASVWESALDRLVETQIRKVFETLKLSFDGLEFEEKELFLNIACFFRGENIERVTRIHDCFGFHPIIGIRILIEKSLIIVSDGKLDMHDLIQEMGWNIVDECAPSSRLWKVEKVHHFIKDKELEGVKAIVLPNKQYSVHQKLLHFKADVFEKMKNLQLLDVSRNFTSCEPTILSHGLRWLSWNQYPFLSLPLAEKCEIVGIEMHGGNIEHLWKGRKIMCNLKCLHLQRLDYLTRFPDVSEAPFIERLVLTSCRNLVEVHESLGYHKRLIYVDVSDCWKLSFFPSRIEMDSLETLIMSRCSSLERFPEVMVHTVRLSNIFLDGCSRIKELPSSIRYLCSLSCLNLARCLSLKNIPNSICELKSLTSLHLDDCVELLTLPEGFGSIENLEELRLGFTDSCRALQRLPQSINFYSMKNMSSLRKLDLSWRQTEDKGFPEDLHVFSSLEELNLSGNFELTALPASIHHLSHLKHLELNDCYKLQILDSLPPGLQVLRASGCSSLEMIEDLPEKYEWLYKIWLIGCWKLPDQEDETNPSKLLLLSFLKKCAAVGHRLSIAIPGKKIPSWLKQQYGCDISIELPPRWRSCVKGFAVSCVFNRMWKIGRDYPVVKFRIENYGELVPVSDISNPVFQSQILFADGKKTSNSKRQNRMRPRFSEVDYMNDASSSADIDTVWIGYVPIGSFELIGDDWSAMEGNLAISIKLKTGQLPVRCGIHVVYKENLEANQQTNTSIYDYSKLDCVRRVGQSYIYEDKF